MFSSNYVIGRLGQDVALRFTHNQTPVATLSVAEKRAVKNGEKWEDRCVWHKLTAWGTQAERLSKILRKGSQGLFHFRIDYREAILRTESGDVKTHMPALTITGFEPLSEFGNNNP